MTTTFWFSEDPGFASHVNSEQVAAVDDQVERERERVSESERARARMGENESEVCEEISATEG